MSDVISGVPKRVTPLAGLATSGEIVGIKVTKSSSVNGAPYGAMHVIVDSGAISPAEEATVANTGALPSKVKVVAGYDGAAVRVIKTDSTGIVATSNSTLSVVGSGTQAAALRVTLATDTAIPAGTNNIGDVDVLTMPDGNGTVTTYTHSNVSLGNSSTSLLASNSSRKYALIVNDSDVKVYLNLAGGTASATAGIPIQPNGGAYELSPKNGNLVTGAITGITASGSSKSILIVEGT